MRYGSYFKIQDKITENLKESLVLTHYQKERINALKKGLFLTIEHIDFGLNSDDFTRNLLTVVVRYNGCKVPRFMKHHLAKKILLS